MVEVWESQTAADRCGGQPGETTGGGCEHRRPACAETATFAATLLDGLCGAWVSIGVCGRHALEITDRPVFAHWSDVCELPEHVGLDVTVRPFARG